MQMYWIEDDSTLYRVIINHEEQYSILPSSHDDPAGWRDAGFTGTRKECLAYISQVWTDLRPLSVRRAMRESVRKRSQ